jgi:hypothetical protein
MDAQNFHCQVVDLLTRKNLQHCSNDVGALRLQAFALKFRLLSIHSTSRMIVTLSVIGTEPVGFRGLVTRD